MIEALHTWLLDERARMSKHNSVAKAIDYLTLPKTDRWAAVTAFLDDCGITRTTKMTTISRALGKIGFSAVARRCCVTHAWGMTFPFPVDVRPCGQPRRYRWR